MELDEETLDGHWSTDVKNGMDFFIINDAIFSKLCILGEDVEPCFEGASVTAPQVSSSFSKVDNDFKQTLFTMMQDLKFALEGGKDMEMENKEVIEETATETEAIEEITEEPKAEETETTETSIDTETTSTEESAEEAPASEFSEEETSNTEETEEEATEEDGEETPSEEESNEEESAEESEEESEEITVEDAIADTEEIEENAEAAEEFSLEDYQALKASYSELENKYNELKEFKDEIDLKNKNDLINSFVYLSEDDKKDVKEHINEYSLDEIEAKLSVIYVRNKVNFDSEDKAKNNNEVEEENSTVTTYNMTEHGSSVPAWISACINTQNSKNN